MDDLANRQLAGFTQEEVDAVFLGNYPYNRLPYVTDAELRRGCIFNRILKTHELDRGTPECTFTFEIYKPVTIEFRNLSGGEYSNHEQIIGLLLDPRMPEIAPLDIVFNISEQDSYYVPLGEEALVPILVALSQLTFPINAFDLLFQDGISSLIMPIFLTHLPLIQINRLELLIPRNAEFVTEIVRCKYEKLKVTTNHSVLVLEAFANWTRDPECGIVGFEVEPFYDEEDDEILLEEPLVFDFKKITALYCRHCWTDMNITWNLLQKIDAVREDSPLKELTIPFPIKSGGMTYARLQLCIRIFRQLEVLYLDMHMMMNGSFDWWGIFYYCPRLHHLTLRAHPDYEEQGHPTYRPPRDEVIRLFRDHPSLRFFHFDFVTRLEQGHYHDVLSSRVLHEPIWDHRRFVVTTCLMFSYGHTMRPITTEEGETRIIHPLNMDTVRHILRFLGYHYPTPEEYMRTRFLH